MTERKAGAGLINRKEGHMDQRKSEFVEPEVVAHKQKLADITAGPVGYVAPDAT